MPIATKPPGSKAGDNADADIWSSLLDSVAGGKRLPEKHLLVLGSSPLTQRDFIDLLANDHRKAQQKGREKSRVPVANEFALGYTYQDVLDADQEDVLARLSIHTLPDASPSFAALLSALINPLTGPETLAVILLDWAEPWNWVDQLCSWIQLLRASLDDLPPDTKEVLDSVMHDWAQKRRGVAHDMAAGGLNSDPNVSMPLGEGEWDEPLGLPLCVVCHNSEKIDILEREHNWREEEFDYLLQFLRTILLKHGASLVYTSNTVPNSVPLLVQASLGIHSSLSRQALKHNVVDRDKILIPPNWDTWGKIRVLREGFDIEGVSSGWSERIQPATAEDLKTSNGIPSALAAFDETIQNPDRSKQERSEKQPNGGLEVEPLAMQEFLARQLEAMEQLKVEEETQKLQDAKDSDRVPESAAYSGENGRTHVDEQIGPVQFNMGGIQVDAEDVLRRIKQNARDHSLEKKPAIAASAGSSGSTSISKIDPTETQQLSNFFSSLIKRGTSTPGTPQGRDT